MREALTAKSRIVCGLFLLAALGAGGSAAAEAPSIPSPVVTAFSGNLEADDLIDVHVDNLSAWVMAHHDPWKLVPYLNGRSLSVTFPTAVNVARGQVQFQLSIKAENNQAWINLLSPPALERPVAFSLGLEREDPFESRFTADSPLHLTVIEFGWGIAAAAAALLSLILFVLLALRTDILRDSGNASDGRSSRYSLVKVQMAFWFFVIFDAFLAIWITTGRLDILNASAIALLGISAGTAITDQLVSGTRTDSSDENEAAPPEAGEAPTPSPSSTTTNARARRRTSRPGGFFGDILSDENGYCFYKFQMLAWTLALGITFISNAYYNLSLPDFKPEMLYLLGISSGTYLGFRVPDAKSKA